VLLYHWQKTIICKYQVIGYKINRNTNEGVLSGFPEHPHQKFGIIGKPLRYKRLVYVSSGNLEAVGMLGSGPTIEDYTRNILSFIKRF